MDCRMREGRGGEEGEREEGERKKEEKGGTA
jgi:hypothetical protein